jgi:glycosyltransferase involved in cell wall biosynthesis
MGITSSIRRRLKHRRALVADARSEDLYFVGPLPPEPTGIATYDRAVLDGLERIGYAQRRRMQVTWPVRGRDVIEMQHYGLGIMQLGNNIGFHLEPYRAVYLLPSLVVLHDLALDDFVRGLTSIGDPLGYLAARDAATLHTRLRSRDIVRNEPLRQPWCSHVARRARGIIVHAEFCKSYLEEFGCRTPVFVVPHPVPETERSMAVAAERGRELRAIEEAAGARTVVVAPGDLNEAKRLDALVEAAASLDPDVHVVLVGRTIEGYDIDEIVAGSGLGRRVTVHADVSDVDFLGWIHAADIVVDLRFPHRGEVSGSLARAMQAGRPSIVSATGTYLDTPDDAVVRIAPGPPDPAELAGELRALAGDEDLRSRMGMAAAAHTRHLQETEATANGYVTAIEETLALLRDPARKALAGWGTALVDVGVSPALLEEGFGLDYARAVESFRPPDPS